MCIVTCTVLVQFLSTVFIQQGTQLFENRPSFWEPDDQINRIYDQLAQNKCREIPRDFLTYVYMKNVVSCTLCCFHVELHRKSVQENLGL